MTPDGAPDGSGRPRGFAGLSAQVSDIEADIARASVRTPASNPDRTQNDTASSPSGRATFSYEHDGTQTGSPAKAIAWVVAGLVLLLVIWLAARPDSSSTGPVTSVPFEESTAFPETQSGQEQPSVPDGLSEEMPPVGAGLTLGTDQIRYCLAEDIRIDASGTVVNEYDQSQIDRFNATVADYNSRCSSFQYAESSMSAARSDVEAHRAELEQAGKARFLTTSGSVESIDNGQSSPVDPAGDDQAPVTSEAVPGAGEGETGSTPPASPPQDMPDLSGLTQGERESLDMACRATASLGSVVHNQCLQNQISQLKISSREPDMSRLTYIETQALQRSCMTAKSRGPASYNTCLIAKMPIRFGN